PGGDTLKEIVATFGTGVTNDDGSLNRKALGAIVFKDKAALSRLNKIIHPAILSNILTELKDIKDSRVSKDRQCTVVIDAPLLFEAGLQNITDQVWVVAADKNTRLKRIIRRDGLSHEQAMQRMASQMSQRDKMDKADKVIRNDGTLENTYLQVKRFWREMKMSPSGDDHNCAPPKE
ncbi:MAG TPA: dephospho-CoA kinase, partial [Clostridia bacterium]|nr:dephospho-CoA kinase [Clostridia bacterium]